jgi:hypothetical protein
MTYASGERHPQAKLTDAKVAELRDLYERRTARIAEIDAQIEKLELERMRLRDKYSHRQLSLDFNIAVVTVARLIRRELRG